MTDEFDPAALNAHQKALLAQTNDFQKAWFKKELNPAEKAEVMALHTGISPEGDRPLLRRPEPEYVSSREMLDVLWRRSPYAPIDKAFDHEMDYAFEIDDPEIDEFEDWLSAVFTLGLLPASVKGDDDSYRAARIGTPAPDDLVDALRKNLPISVHVRTAGISDKGIEPAFPNLTPEEATNGPLWFKRADVESLSCHADDMRDVVRRAENDDPLADLDPELVRHTTKRRADALVKMGAMVSTDLAPEAAAPADNAQLAPNPGIAPAPRGRPSDLKDRFKECCWVVMGRKGGENVTDARHLRALTSDALTAAKKRDIIPGDDTAREASKEVFHAYKRGEDNLEHS